MDLIAKGLAEVINRKGSDLHITTGKPVKVRVRGQLINTEEKQQLTLEELSLFVKINMPDMAKKFTELINGNISSIDGALDIATRRFRVHFYKSSSGIAGAFRLLQAEIPHIDSLNLPPTMKKFITSYAGLVIVAGATGSGKTTTLASLINEINKERNDMIVTIEDPIEYVYQEINCRIEQREIGKHVDSFKSATVDALREDPNIILLGEMRDLDTIQNALTLAETGHLVFATLHTKSVLDSVDRIVDVFPSDQQKQARVQLSSVLLGVAHQSLVQSDGKMVPVVELLVVDAVVRNMLKQQQGSNQIMDYLRGKKEMGNVHKVDNIAWHIKENRLNQDDALALLSDEEANMLNNIAKTLIRNTNYYAR